MGQGQVKSLSPVACPDVDFIGSFGTVSGNLLIENQRALPVFWKRPL
jgi:hypothetical protein